MTLQDILQAFHQFGAYTGVVITIAYLVTYTVFYDWHRSKAGWMMNSTLLFIILIGLAATFSSQGLFLFIVKPILGIGWFGFSAALTWRMFELIKNHKDHVEIIDEIREDECVIKHTEEEASDE